MHAWWQGRRKGRSEGSQIVIGEEMAQLHDFRTQKSSIDQLTDLSDRSLAEIARWWIFGNHETGDQSLLNRHQHHGAEADGFGQF